MTTKTRILAGGHHTSFQQVVRIDHEPDDPLPDGVAARLAEAAQAVHREVDVVIASDYGFGVFDADMIGLINGWEASRGGVPVLVDSQTRFPAFRRITAITPNEPEASAAAGVPLSDDPTSIRRMGRILLDRTEARLVLITKGRAGMSLFRDGFEPFDISIFGDDEVSDVTGAGDTVISTMALALAAGADPELAVALANVAAGLVVQKRGTATVSSEELIGVLERSGEVPG